MAGAIEMTNERMERRLSAILAADIAGYSALMGADEARTVRDLKGHQAVVLPMVGEFAGRIIDTAGDGILAEFPSVVNAVECAVAIQSKMAERNATIEPERRMQFRVGINIGDVVYDEVRIYGDGINVAARLEGIAEAGGICISSKVYEEISGRTFPARTSASSSSKTSRGRCEPIGYAWIASRQQRPQCPHYLRNRPSQSCRS
jgi:adenylate cyclase